MNDDLNLTASTWHNVYTLSGLSVGTALLIYNVGSSLIRIWEGGSSPSTESGVPVMPGDPIVVESGAAGCWVHSRAPISINVQVYV